MRKLEKLIQVSNTKCKNHYQILNIFLRITLVLNVLNVNCEQYCLSASQFVYIFIIVTYHSTCNPNLHLETFLPIYETE